MASFGNMTVRRFGFGFLRTFIITITAIHLLPPVALARIESFPPDFRVETIATNGAKIYVRVGGKGPAVVMLHGFGDTGDMWAPVAAALARNHTVVVLVERMGLYAPGARYDEKTGGDDIARVMGRSNRRLISSRDIGNIGLRICRQFRRA